MKRLNYIIEDPAMDDHPSDATCDVCGKGPFKQVAKHKAKSHPETVVADSEVADDDVDAVTIEV